RSAPRSAPRRGRHAPGASRASLAPPSASAARRTPAVEPSEASAGFVGQEDRLGDLAHALARVHAQALDASEGFCFFEVLAVHRDQVGSQCPGEVHRGHAVARFADDAVTQVLEHLAQVHARDGFVFSNEDTCIRHAGYSPLAIHFGKDTTACTPCPLVSSNSPLRSSRTRLRTICIPRPPCRTISNSCGKPRPSSWISMHMLSPCSASFTTMFPPCSPTNACSTAF